ncbi:MAG: LacI family transcriptional regulator [Oscillospiraceae bacterium]|nr:LacI family transcriptional regulator [Oscillospiraceae bacterium]
MEHKNVTLKDVATKVGVSVATVSRVLNNSTYVHEDIIKNVEDAVEELGYYQNIIAKSLKTNSTLTIAFITADISNPYMITVAKAIEDLVHVEKYHLLVCSTQGDPKRELEHLKLQMGRNIDGLVINTTGYNGEYIADISKRMPVILIHRDCDAPGFVGDLVDSDNEEGVYALTKHLISFGHRRIFVIKGDRHTSNNLKRYRGFVKAMAEAGINIDDSYPFQYDGKFSEECGYRAIEYLSKLPECPTAVLGLNNTMTIGALKGLAAHNLSVPDTISVAGYNSIDNRELLSVRPCIHFIDPREIGLIAGKALLERLTTPEIPKREFVLNGYMVNGNAVGAPCDISV